MPATEERKLVTVLFADIVGSTALASEQDPERVRALMDRFYEAMQEEIAASGGTVEKFAGDAVLASFGAPAAQEDHAERALHTALSMCRRVKELVGEQLAIRVGVNTGEVVVGPARAGGSFLTGDAVNVAARLEQGAGPGEILVGERTVAAVRGAFEFDEPATVEAKGKPGGVVCSRLVRAVTLMRPRGIAGREAVFVGRQAELTQLEEAYGRVVAEGRPRLVTIAGEPGVGKTRLVRELWGRLAGESPQPFRRTGRCLAYGQFTYWPLGEVLKEHLRILETDSPEVVRERLRGREILGLALGLDVALDLHPLAARDQLHEAWVGFLDELAAERPTVVLVEDLHWAEESLLDLLARTVRDVRGPLLLVTTTRPELLAERSAWGAGRQSSSVLPLEALGDREAALLADELAGEALSAELRDAIVARAEGNPFFVEELIAALGEPGAAESRLPDSVKAVLAARIDLLPPTEKAALQAAAVIGRIFWPGPVRVLIGGEEPDWWLLEDREFVHRRSGSSILGEVEYAIKHALTREVAYEGLPRAQRARLHASFGDWLERIGEGRDEHAALLAHHYAEAVRPEDADLAWAGAADELERVERSALTWLRKAAGLAVGRYDIDEGLALLHRAVALAPESELAGLWREIGRANALKFDGEAFWDAMLRAIDFDQDDRARGELYSLLVFYTAHRSGMWKRRPERELVDGWIEKALELAEPGSKAQARTLVAKAYWHPDSEEAVAREASALADRLGDIELRSYAWLARSAAAFSAARYQEAFDWAQRRFDIWDQIGDPDHAGEMLEETLPTTIALGRFKEARRLSWDYVARAVHLTPHHRVHGMSMVVETEESVGDWEAIREVTPDVEQVVADNLATPCVRNARSLLVCAAANLYCGDEAAAEALERTADEFGIDVAARLNGPRIRIALARGDLDAVRTLVDEMEPAGRLTFGLQSAAARFDALAILRAREEAEAEAPRLLQPGTFLEPFALRALGIVRDDEVLIAEAQEHFKALGLEWHAAQTEALVQQA